MAIDFPDSPAVNDVYSTGGRTWRYNGTSWLLTSVEQTIAPLSIDASKIAADSVTTAKIAANAVTSAKLDSGIITFVTCTSSTRPSSPATGQPIFETDTFQLLFWNGSSWMNGGLRPPLQPTGLSATPGTTTVDISFTAGSSPLSAITNYEYALSTNGGTSYGSWTALSPADATSPITITGLTMATSYYVKLRGVNSIGSGVESSAASFTTLSPISIDYLIIGGGGTGGNSTGSGACAGGGGAGGYRSSVSGESNGGGQSLDATIALSPGSYTVTVGGAGSSSSFGGVTATAGSNGGNNGGSGGAAGTYGYSGGATRGGGGGAGAAGAAGTVVDGYRLYGGNGGAGTSSSITGSAVTRAGGGGGGGDQGTTASRGTGGAGGGGNGAADGIANSAGAANTGSGGGGASHQYSGYTTGSPGGSGVVIIRYLTSAATGFTITGGTSTTSGSYTIRTFNSSGSLVIS